MKVSTTGLIVAAVVAGAVALAAGILIGHFAISKPSSATPESDTGLRKKCGTQDEPLDNLVIKDFMNKSELHACQAVTCDLSYPVSYVVYHLGGATINVDGKLDDEAWKNTPKIDKFVNIQGPDFPGPWYQTYAMVRWDDSFLYVGAYMEEQHLWANKTEHNTRVYQDKSFEVFVDTDFSTHWYKEWQINALNTTWDLMLSRPYLNGGDFTNDWEIAEAGGRWSVHVNGTVNDPSDTDRYWSMEVAFPFSLLIQNKTNQNAKPVDGDQWRINLSRVQYQLDHDGTSYWQKEGTDASYWVWSPQYAVALHIPERWGMIEFSIQQVGSKTYQKWPDWNVYSSLFAVYNQIKMYQGLNGPLPSNLSELALPPHVFSDVCSHPPTYTRTDPGWEVEVKARGSGRTGIIRDDRFVTFVSET